mgnify:CR=1 FL=1
MNVLVLPWQCILEAEVEMLKFVKYVSCFTIPYDMQDK